SARVVPICAKAFLIQIARNLVIDRKRRLALRSIEIARGIDNCLEVFDSIASPERQLGARQDFEHFVSAFSRVPPRRRQSILLRRVEGLSKREAASRMGVSEKAIERHLAVGMHRLTKILHEA